MEVVVLDREFRVPKWAKDMLEANRLAAMGEEEREGKDEEAEVARRTMAFPGRRGVSRFDSS